MFNPGALPGPYSGGSGVVPSGTFDLFDPMGSSTLPLLPPVHGDVGPTTAASTAATQSFIASAGRKRTHSQQVSGDLKRRKGFNHEGGPRAAIGQWVQDGQSTTGNSAAASRQYGGLTESSYGQPSETTMGNTSVGLPTTFQPSVSTIAPPTHFTPLPRPGGMSDEEYGKLLHDHIVQQFANIRN